MTRSWSFAMRSLILRPRLCQFPTRRLCLGQYPTVVSLGKAVLQSPSLQWILCLAENIILGTHRLIFHLYLVKNCFFTVLWSWGIFSGSGMLHISYKSRQQRLRVDIQHRNSEGKGPSPSASLGFIQAVRPRGKVTPDLTVWRNLYNGSSVISDSVWKPLVQPPPFQPRDAVLPDYVKIPAFLSLPTLCRKGSCADSRILGEGFMMVARGGVIRGYPRHGHVHGHGAALNSFIPWF